MEVFREIKLLLNHAYAIRKRKAEKIAIGKAGGQWEREKGFNKRHHWEVEEKNHWGHLR